ncbi:MAG: CHRD domain-containing protein [Verrucomicrobia bacterium]|jgi:hypothetical protein|nr:CHRD domain-containing protein [Verrucomicrobiota bacterium]
MKSIAVLLASAAACQALVLEFDLSPEGTDQALGLSPSNAVPAVTNSIGAGNELGEGIYLDTDTGILMMNFGYGSAGGFTNNLTGAVTLAAIYGPAAAGQASSNLVADLAEIHFLAFTGPTNGGIVQGAVEVTDTNQVKELRDGLWYVNLATDANPEGEIRGQLILANAAPVIACPGDVTTECGELTRTEITVSDADGDDVTIQWMVNGVAMNTVVIPGDAALASTNLVIEAEYPLGTNLLEFVATDTVGETSRCSATVFVEDTTPPEITGVTASPTTLWPPNHQMVEVNVQAIVEDACGEAEWTILNVTSNEPINGTGDGNTDPDWVKLDSDTVELRAERSGNLSGRVYTIWVGAEDASGNTAEPEGVAVTVPHDQKQDQPAKKSGLSKWLWFRWR